jgi:non-ribosomal peptide synthetase component E (peptide arylation enzyme)
LTNAPGQTGNQAAFAAFKDVSRQTVTDWKKRGLLIYRPDGEVDFLATDQRLTDHGIRQPADTNLTEVTAIDGEELWSRAEAEQVKENYAARLKQLEFERESGRVVTIDDAAEIFAAVCGIVRKRLRRISADVAPNLSGMTSAAEIKAAIDAAVVQALADLSAV